MEKKQLKGIEKLAFALGAVGKDMVYMLSASFVLYYYDDLLGVSKIFMGALLMGARIFDAFNDPFMGVLVAKTKSKFGKFRPWLLSGTVLNAFVLYFLFAVPQSLIDTKGVGLMVYASVAYIMWGITYTMMDIPYWSMVPAFSTSAKETEGLSQLGRTCAGVGAAIITVVTMKAVTALGGAKQLADEEFAKLDAAAQASYLAAQKAGEINGFKFFTIIVGVFFIATAVFMFVTMKEKSTVEMKTVSVGQMFKSLLNNDQAMTVVAVIVLINVSVYLTSNLVIYFFKYDFGGADWYNAYTLFNTFGGGIQVISMMLLFPLIRKFMSTTQTFKFSLCMCMIGYALLLAIASFTSMGNVYVLFIPAFFIFASNGILTVLTTIFLSNTVEYGELKNGSREESVIFSMQTFVVKLASGVSTFLATICLTVFDITEVDTSNTADLGEAVSNLSQRMGLRMTMTLIPVAGLIVAIILFKNKFILTDNKMTDIRAELESKKNA